MQATAAATFLRAAWKLLLHHKKTKKKTRLELVYLCYYILQLTTKCCWEGGRKLKYPAIWAFIVFNWTNTKQLTPENDRSKKYYILGSYFGFWANMKINQHIYFFANVAILGSVSEFIQIDPFICFKNAFIYPTNNRFNKKNIFV